MSRDIFANHWQVTIEPTDSPKPYSYRMGSREFFWLWIDWYHNSSLHFSTYKEALEYIKDFIGKYRWFNDHVIHTDLHCKKSTKRKHNGGWIKYVR